MSAILEAVDPRGVATLTLDRPERHNAFDDALIGEMAAALRRLGGRPEIRAMVLASTGRSFSVSADLDWMRRMARHTVGSQSGIFGRQPSAAPSWAFAAMLRTCPSTGRVSFGSITPSSHSRAVE